MNDILKFIGSVAPTVATMLGGPLAGVIASVAGRIFMGNDKASPDDVLKFVAQNQNPETLVKLKELEVESARLVSEHEISLEQINQSDRASARQREISVRDWVPSALAALVVSGFLYTIYAIFTGQVKGLNDPTTNVIIGALIGYISSKTDVVITYYFGSSAGSRQKSDDMANVLSNGVKNGSH